MPTILHTRHISRRSLRVTPPQETVSQGEVRRGVRILPAQLLKDAVMAWSIDKQLVQGKNVVVLAGAGHLEYGFGVLDRVREANREERMLIICKSTNESRLWLHEGVAGQGVRGVEKSNRATEAAPTRQANRRCSLLVRRPYERPGRGFMTCADAKFDELMLWLDRIGICDGLVTFLLSTISSTLSPFRHLLINQRYM